MKRFLNGKTTGLVVMLSCMFLALSCVNNDYELSEDKINTDVTIFQEGLTLPLGTTAPIKMGDLYGMLDPELQEIIQNKDGKYGFSYAGNIDLTDTLASVKEMLAIDALSIKENFSFNLSNVSLDGVKFAAQNISPASVDISSMLDFSFELPEIKSNRSLVNSLPEISTDALALSFESISRKIDVASFEGVDIKDIYMNFIDWEDNDLTYNEIKANIDLANAQIPGSPLPTLPELDLETGIKPFEKEVSLALSLPKEIQTVKKVELGTVASVKIGVKAENSLFTDGELALDIDLSKIFDIQGADANGKVTAAFGIGKNNSASTREFKVNGLKIASDDWKSGVDGLSLNKNFAVSLAPKITKALTTLNHLRGYKNGCMQVEMTLEFCGLSIENVEMEIAPIEFRQSFGMPISVPNVALPEMVKEIEYVALENPLNLFMKAELPEAFKNLSVKLESLDIDFPQALEVKGVDNNGRLSYKDVTISTPQGFSDAVTISKLNLPKPVNGNLSFSDNVNVLAVAKASGIVNSRDLLDKSKIGKVTVDIDVNYLPALKDYSVVIDDYPYTVDIDPISINEKLPAAVGEMNEIAVYLENNPEITISLNYPTAGGAISIIPHREKGLKIFFPDMIRFENLPSSYNYDSTSNSISFTGNAQIPNQIVLPIEKLLVKPQKDGEDYYVKGEMKVEGGVCLAGTTITKSIVDRLVDEKAKISFSAHVPELKPATLALDQYVASISQSMDFEMPSIKGIPDMIDIKSVDAFDLDNVYLNLSVDASSVVKLIEGAQLSMNFDVKLPELIKVENASEGNVIKISGQLDNNNKIVMEPLHVLGLDLSSIDFNNGTIEIGKQSIAVDGNVTINNVSLDLADLKGADLKVAIEGSLATKDTELIKIAKVQAKVDCQFELNESFDLSSLTAQLGDKLDFMIDFNRFHLDFDLKTNLSIPVQLSELKVVPYKGGVAGSPLQIDEPIALNTNTNGQVTHSKIRISNLESDKHDDPEYHHVVLDVLSLVKDMPDSIQVHLNAGTKENATFVVEPSLDYVLAADYALELPLELGEDFLIEFADTLGGLPSVLGDVLALGSLGLSGEVINSFPLALDLEFQLLDVEGNAVPMADNAGHQTIKAGNLDGSPVTTQLNVVLGVQKGIEIPQIDAVKLIFRATSSGAGLAEDNFIQVQLNALIPEGVSVDLKELMGTPSDPEIQK